PLLPPPSTSSLFPYTTLFRSGHAEVRVGSIRGECLGAVQHPGVTLQCGARAGIPGVAACLRLGQAPTTQFFPARQRSKILALLLDRKSTRLNSSHRTISYAVF